MSESAQPARGGWRRIAVVIATIAILAVAFQVFVRRANTPDAAPTAKDATSVPGLQRDGDSVSIPAGSPYRDRIAIVPITTRDLEQTLTIPSIVEADPAGVFNVLPPLGGRVLALKVGLGDRVQAGQPLVLIASGDLAAANADLEKARSQVELTHRTLDRARGLLKAGGGAVKDAESAANDAAQADAELARAQTRYDTIAGSPSTNGGKVLTISAPASGTVTALQTAPGVYVNDPNQTMLTISDLSRIWVTANVAEGNLGFVFKGQAVDVSFIAYPGATFPGKVLFVSAILEPDTRRAKARIGFDNADGRLKPNMFATTTFHAPPRAVLPVPDSALIMNNDTTSVFVETAPWTFVRRAVQLGFGMAGETVVTSGLSSGDRIVARGGVLLND